VYAWEVHREYIERFGQGTRRVVFFGMNPGPWGMLQTGVPFGDVPSVRDWLGLSGRILQPSAEHPRRPILGWDCERREVSGTRLWGLFADRFGTPKRFFADHFVGNYCPLGFLAESGANVTPDKIRSDERGPLLQVCDKHLGRTIDTLAPTWVVGVGAFARKRLEKVCAARPGVRVAHILHPSPASPAANRGWAEKATAQLTEQGVWSDG
jgi:single-strand selective monofunctional uracil DNA glycosylase